MIRVIKYFLIGLIQGLTEFLPISSSGHIVLFGSLFSLDNLLLLSIVAHIGTLFAVLFCYRKKLFGLVKKPFNKTNLNLLIATIPTIIIVLLFNSFFKSGFSVSGIVWGFLVSAVLLFIADFKADGNKYFNKKRSVIMGIAQGLAVLPGISRSGTTLVTGLMLGVEKTEALDFSFLMSIPIILASAAYECFDIIKNPVVINWTGILVVLLSSFVFGILSIKIMLKLVKKNHLFYFSFYLIFLSLAILVLI